jgi:hypothetical protein
MAGILEYLGKSTRTGATLQNHHPKECINDLLRLSHESYNKALYSCVVDEMRLAYLDGEPVSTFMIKSLKHGDIPPVEECPLRSKEFEEKIQSASVLCYDTQGKLSGAWIHTKPTQGYRFSSGKDSKGDPALVISYPELRPQAHLWEAVFLKEMRNNNIAIAAGLAATSLSTREGANYLTWYASIHSQDGASTLASEYLARRFPIRNVCTFPMLNDQNEMINNGQLYALELGRVEVHRGLDVLEREIIERLWP